MDLLEVNPPALPMEVRVVDEMIGVLVASSY